MRLLSIELESVGIHKKLSESLDANLVGIVGPNGSGKSTLLSAIYYALTGDGSRFGSASGIEGASEPEESLVRLIVSPSGREDDVASISRWLPQGKKPGRRKLVYGERVWTSADDVTKEIQNWCKVPLKTLADFVFVRQDGLTSIVSDQPARRADVIHKLFDLAAAEKGREAVSDALVALPAPPDPVLLATIKTRKLNVENETAMLQASLSSLPTYNQTRLDNLIEELRKYDDKTTDTRIQEIDSRISDLRATIEKTYEVEEPDESSIVLLKEMLRTCDDYDVGMGHRSLVLGQVERLQAELAALVEPPAPGDEPVKPADVDRDCPLARMLRGIVELGGSAECPTCCRPLDASAPGRVAAAIKLREIETKRHWYEIELSDYQKKAKQQNSYRETQERLRSEISTSLKLVGPEPQASEFPRDVVSTELDSLLEQKRRYSDSCTDRASALSWLRDYVQRREDLTRQLSKLDDLQAEECRSWIEKAKADEQQRHSIVAQLMSLNRTIESDNQILSNATTISDTIPIWRSRLEGVRDLLHRDAAPTVAARQCLLEVSESINTRLGNLAADFRVSVHDDGNLWAEFGGDRKSKVRSDLLSKGQQVVLAVAWMLAVADRFCPDVGILCLDEPTAGLDSTRIDALRSALEAWKPFAGDRQFVIVTHDRRLLGVFDKVIELG